ncbi:MAG: hypothetical protein M1305_02255 [Candidatus Marsarchaeota archaeon]|nr:hypothetical protein [Candidatus Marsarchaeota archaeon]
MLSGTLAVQRAECLEDSARAVKLGAPVRILRVPGHIQALAFSADGKLLAASWSPFSWRTKGGRLSVWNARTGKLIRHIRTKVDVVVTALSPDGTMLAGFGYGEVPVPGQGRVFSGSMGVWNVKTGRPKINLVTSMLYPTLAFSPNGKVLALAGTSKGVEDVILYNTATWRQIGALHFSAGTMLHAAFSPDGKRLASLAGERHGLILAIRDVDTGKQVFTFNDSADLPVSDKAGRLTANFLWFTRMMSGNPLFFISRTTLICGSYYIDLSSPKSGPKRLFRSDELRWPVEVYNYANGLVLYAAATKSERPLGFELWDVRSGKLKRKWKWGLQQAGDIIWLMDFSLRDRLLAGPQSDATIGLWRLD